MKEARVVLDEARNMTHPDGRLFLLRTTVGTNKPLGPALLRQRFYVVPMAILGHYRQIGTRELVSISLNRLHAKPSPTTRAPDGDGAEQ
jgi:hypothetical protein